MILGIFYGLGAALCQSTSYLATRHYVQRRLAGASLQLLVLGHVWMGVFALILLPMVWPAVGIPWRAVVMPLVLTTVFYLGGQLSLVTALKHAEASRVSPLMTSKLILTATMASIFGQPVGTNEAWITPLQWAAVLMCLVAGVSINFSGGRMKAKAAVAIAAASVSFAMSDYAINLMIKAFLTEPGIDRFHASLLTECFCYGATALLALPLLGKLGSRETRDWSGAAPFALTWFLAMVFLFLAFSTVGLMLGSILQCTRGFITILLGAGLMYAGHEHIEARQPRGVVLRRLAAGLLMFMGISLYVIRDPSALKLHKQVEPARVGGGMSRAERAAWTPIMNCSPRGMFAKRA